MSFAICSILNPMSPDVRSRTLTRGAYLREILLSVAMALTLPGLLFAGRALLPADAQTAAAMIISITVASVTVIPLILYADFRLNAATLARERTVFPQAVLQIEPPLRGPFVLRSSMLAGTVRSRVMSGLPTCVAFGVVFAIFAVSTPTGAFFFLLVPIGLMVVVQIMIVVGLMR